jgi:hypothetical protein
VVPRLHTANRRCCRTRVLEHYHHDMFNLWKDRSQGKRSNWTGLLQALKFLLLGSHLFIVIL